MIRSATLLTVIVLGSLCYFVISVVSKIDFHSVHPTCEKILAPCQGQCDEVLRIIKKQRSDSTWNVYYGDIVNFIKKNDLEKSIFVEVGIAYGGLTAAMLQALPDITYHSVDPFLAGYDDDDAMSNFYRKTLETSALTAHQFSKLWARAIEHSMAEYSKPCPGRFTLHHDVSASAAGRFERHSIDVVFIDGLHTRAGVLLDIYSWLHVVKPGGWLIFNDYGRFQVADGVDPLVKQLGAELIDLKNSNVAVRLPTDVKTIMAVNLPWLS